MTRLEELNKLLAGKTVIRVEETMGQINIITNRRVAERRKQVIRDMQGNVTDDKPDKPSRFDLVDRALGIDKVAPVLKFVAVDAPKPLAEVRQNINDLIREAASFPMNEAMFDKLLGIIEQIVMKLENVPQFNWTIPSIAPFPMVPPPIYPQPNTTPFGPHSPSYIGDPPFPGSTTICRAETVKHGTAMCQADGHAADDIPF